MFARCLGFTTLLLALLAGCVLARENRISGGEGVGEVKLGQVFSQVQRLLGPPGRSQPSSADPSARMVYYDAQGLALLIGKGDKILGITVSSKGYQTPEALQVGSPREQVLKAYGQGLERGQGNLTYAARGLGFSFDAQGQVTHIYVFMPEADRPLLGDRLIIPGQRAGKIQLGSAIEALRQAWGAPTSSQDLGGGRQLLTYQTQGVRLMVAGSSIDAILITTGDFITREGLKVGASLSQIEASYGKGYTRKGAGLFYAEKGIGFLLGNDSVLEIQVLFAR